MIPTIGLVIARTVLCLIITTDLLIARTVLCLIVVRNTVVARTVPCLGTGQKVQGGGGMSRSREGVGVGPYPGRTEILLTTNETVDYTF